MKKYLCSISALALGIFLGLLVIGYLSFQSFMLLKDHHYREGKDSFLKAFMIGKEKANSYVYGLQGTGGFYQTTNFKISNKEFREYAQFREFFNNFPGALGYGFIRYVPSKQLPQYFRKVKQEAPDFHLRRLSEEKTDDYFIIESIEPLEKNLQARGLDVGSESKRRLAALLARDSGLPTITEQIQLVQVDKKEPGFLFFLPLYKKHSFPKTVEDRRKNFIGWAYAPILVSSIGAHIRKSADSNLELSISEVHESGKNSYIYGSLEKKDATFSEILDVGGKKWHFSGRYGDDRFFRNSWLLPLMGFLLFGTFHVLACYFIRNLMLSRVATEKRAKNIEDRMTSLVNGASFAIIAVDSQGFINTMNPAAEKMLGYRASELHGRTNPEIFHDRVEVEQRASDLTAELGVPVHAGFQAFIAKAKKDGVDSNEWTYIRKNGEKLRVRLVVTPIFDAERNIEGYLGIAEDITEIEKMRATIRLQQQQMVASAKLSSLGEMAGGIAHEINNPLLIINGRLKIIEKFLNIPNVDITRLKEEVKKIEGTANRIAQIVRGLKSFSREGSGDAKEMVFISTIVNDTLTFCNEKFAHHDVQLRVLPYEDFKMSCRPSQVSQVLLNLLFNAYDAVQSFDEKWVELNILSKGEYIHFIVTDSGSGIPENLVEKIMHPFFTTKEVGKGTGLGLSISKGLVESHGGKIYYEKSSPHTQFVVELPIAG